MYIRYKNLELKNPEYKLIVNDDVIIGSNNHLRGDILISLDDLQKGECLQNIGKQLQINILLKALLIPIL